MLIHPARGRLEQYADGLAVEGLEDPAELAALGASELAELLGRVGVKRGHQKKLKMELAELPPPPADIERLGGPAPPAESEDGGADKSDDANSDCNTNELGAAGGVADPAAPIAAVEVDREEHEDGAAVEELTLVEIESQVGGGDEPLTVVCPDGSVAGDLIVVRTDWGQELEVVVPDGVGGGDEFTVTVSSPRAAQGGEEAVDEEAAAAAESEARAAEEKAQFEADETAAMLAAEEEEAAQVVAVAETAAEEDVDALRAAATEAMPGRIAAEAEEGEAAPPPPSEATVDAEADATQASTNEVEHQLESTSKPEVEPEPVGIEDATFLELQALMESVVMEDEAAAAAAQPVEDDPTAMLMALLGPSGGGPGPVEEKVELGVAEPEPELAEEAEEENLREEVENQVETQISGADADDGEMEQLAEFVRTVPLLSGMADEEMSRLVPALVRVDFSAGTVIMRQGDDGDAMYLLEAGSARAEITRVGVVKEYVAGAYFGELALLTSKQRAATVRAGEGGAVCLKLGRAAFQVVVRRSGAALWREVETYAARLVQARWRGKLEWRKVVAATMLMTSSEEEDIVEDVVEEDVAEDFAEEQDDDDDDEAAVAGVTEAEETEEEEMEEETDGKLELAAEVESPTANGTHLPWSSPPAPAFGPAVVPLVRPPSKQSSPTPSGASCSLCGKRRPAAGGVGMHSCKCDAPALMVHRQPSNALAQQHSPPRVYNDDHEVDEGEAAKATKTEDQTAEAVSAADEETEEEADSDSEDPKLAAEGEAEERVGFARTVPRRRPLPKGARPASATPALLEGHQFDEETEEETEEEDSESEEEEASAGNQRRQGATNGPTQPVKPAIAQHRGRARPPPPKPADAPPPPPPVLLPLSPASALPQPNSPASNTAAKQLGQLDELQRLMQAAESAVGASPAPAALPSPGVASVRVAMVEEHEGGLGGLAEGHDEEHGEEEAMQESETEQGDVTEDSEGTEDSASDGGSEPASQSGPPVKIGRTQSQQTRLDRAKKSQAAEQARAKQARLRQAQAQLFRPNSATAEASNRTPTRRAKPQPTVVGGRPSPRLAWAGGAAAKAAAATAERRMRQQRVADARAAAADALSSTTAARWKDRSAGVERVRVAQGQAEAAAVFSATAEQKAASQRGLLARRARERKVPTERGRASAAARAAAAERGGGGGDQVEFHDSLRPAGRLATAAAGQAVSPTAVSGFTLHAETRMAAAVAAPAVGTGAGGRSGADQRKIARRDAMAGRARQRGKSKRPGVVVAGVASKVRM